MVDSGGVLRGSALRRDAEGRGHLGGGPGRLWPPPRWPRFGGTAGGVRARGGARDGRRAGDDGRHEDAGNVAGYVREKSRMPRLLHLHGHVTTIWVPIGTQTLAARSGRSATPREGAHLPCDRGFSVTDVPSPSRHAASQGKRPGLPPQTSRPCDGTSRNARALRPRSVRPEPFPDRTGPNPYPGITPLAKSTIQPLVVGRKALHISAFRPVNR